ncbi:MAG: hypothetical protein UX13_C0034G0004 [Candidatus Woesebacteria bacterium GW2011_GWB1_45_5]|uniref:Uncharacterized protein n=1 Tax=Candidatus Woesebacteria bacterium GW2011_GWB1_45_5 TaxID=1618581 RepID=A0A0G1MNI8_9BACT|nr:MAG: hypothetical protein UX13_C0034G0004 [Candidatus Woesebacteria bacterium GW2011_GWB1_45_5]
MEREQREKGLAHLAAAQSRFIKINVALFTGAISSAVALPSGIVFLGMAAYQFAKMQEEFNASQKIINDNEKSDKRNRKN